MKTVQEIYKHYRILPALQLHQLRVAAVAKLICDNFKKSIETEDVVLACLIHDMGNIIKFDLTVSPDVVQPEGIEYWEKVKADFKQRYGVDHHAANLAITRELGLSEEVQKCIEAVAFARVEQTLAQGSWEEKICEYADSRVSPHGVVSLQARLEEARKRYVQRTVEPGLAAPRERFDALVRAEEELERRLFEHTTVKPEDITDAAVAPIVAELRNYKVV